MQLNQKVAHKLIQLKKTLAIAESCTGGYLSHCLTNVPGSSAFLTAAIVCYANWAKIKLLQISEDVIRHNGAVSKPVAQLMATQIAKNCHTDFGIGITGIAGPGGGSPQKPVGLVYIAVYNSHKTLTSIHHFKGTRLQIKKQSAQKALEQLLKLLT